MKILTPFLVLLASAEFASLHAGQVSLFETLPSGLGRVRVYDEVTGALASAPAGLEGIQLLSLEVNGRTSVTRFLPGRTRFHADLPAGTRAQLPGERGSIYHFARPDPSGSVDFGFFLVDAEGAVRVLHELPGVGLNGTQSPYAARLACAPQGDAFLVSTVPAAGGNLLEVSTGPAPQVIDRTALLPTRRFFPYSLHLTDSWGFAIAKRGVLRFERLPGAQVALVPVATDPAPLNYSGHAALSENQMHAIFTAGDTPATLEAFVCSAIGPALRATPGPLALSGAGYQPEAEDGPHLAVSDDGQLAAWRTEGPVREGWLGRVQAPASDPALHYSNDALFLDTLDEVGVFLFRPDSKFNTAVGSQTQLGANAIESADFFTLDTSATLGSATITNLSLSGDPAAPFLGGVPTITPERMALTEDNQAFWYHDGDPQHGLVSAVRTGQSGAELVLANVKDLDALEFASGWALLSIRRSDGARPYELWRVAQDLSEPAVRILTAADTDFARHHLSSGGIVAFVQARPTSELLRRVRLRSGALESWAPTPSFFGPTLSQTSGGAVAFSELAGPGGPATFRLWRADGGSVAIQTASTSGFVLPGA